MTTKFRNKPLLLGASTVCLFFLLCSNSRLETSSTVAEKVKVKTVDNLTIVSTVLLRPESKAESQKQKVGKFYHGRQTKSYVVGGSRIYGPFVVRENKNIARFVFPYVSFREKKYMFCNFENGTSSEASFDAGAMSCFLPYDTTIALVRSGIIKVSITSQVNSKVAEVDVDAWPLVESNKNTKRFSVVQTSMIKDLPCDKDGYFCLRDWIEWHLMLGVQHFVLYDNGSKDQAPHLGVLQPYVESGEVTLINWPYKDTGIGNNKIQRVAMNHAIYLFSKTSSWIGFFDVDEFFFPARLLENCFEGGKLQYPLIENILRNHSGAVSVSMRTMVHPEHCSDYPSLLAEAHVQNRLADCSHKVRKVSGHDHPKTFRQFPVKPYSITSPHYIRGRKSTRALSSTNEGHFMHYSKKYGCFAGSGFRCEKANMDRYFVEALRILNHRLNRNHHVEGVYPSEVSVQTGK